MTEEETVARIVQWLETEAGEQEEEANKREERGNLMGNDRLLQSGAGQRYMAALTRLWARRIASGEWKTR